MFVSKPIAIFICLMSCLFVCPGWLMGQMDEGGSKHGSKVNDAYRKYADGLLKNYDSNKDGFLDLEETAKMRRPPKNADRDGDGKISRQELIVAVSGRPKTKQRSSIRKNGGLVSGAVSGDLIQGLISADQLKDGNILGLLGGAVDTGQRKQGSVNARFNLIGFDPNTTLKTVRELVSNFNKTEHSSVDEMVARIIERDDVDGNDEVMTILQEDKIVSFHSESPGGNSSVTWEFALSNSERGRVCTVKMHMKMMDDARKNEHVKLLLGERAIEDAILEKLHHRHGAADGGDHRKQSRVLSIDTAIPFQSRGANATLFSHRGRIWILVACFDQDE